MVMIDRVMMASGSVFGLAVFGIKGVMVSPGQDRAGTMLDSLKRLGDGERQRQPQGHT